MNVLVIGSGGREHALVWALRRAPGVRRIICAPGNPGIEDLAEVVPVRVDDIAELKALAERERVDLTIVGPEVPLARGIVDRFRLDGLAIFGPTQGAAELEWSKAFAKAFMDRHAIPTARHVVVSHQDREHARRTLESFTLPVVLKADGLAAGKGVVICTREEDAAAELETMLDGTSFGAAGTRVVIEEFLEGEEASVFAITDGTSYVLLAPAQDHKRVLDGDAGKNTGGMGAYAPAPVVTADVMRTVEEKVLRPTLAGMAAEGRPYTGCLYIGLMLTTQGPRVIEYNCRFGDPETQVVLPLFRGDLARLLYEASAGTIEPSAFPSWRPDDPATAACVVLAAGGYPDHYESGDLITGLDAVKDMEDVVAFHAGTRRTGEGIVTAGGRVLGVTAMDRSGGFAATLARCYDAVKQIHFDRMHYRRDIGHRALRSRH
ncbi:MAG: phosphoribosylamine--glycine ligase [Ignavibacteriae bacterium]|nr:phosphoribosylamine--glycine ligase [Ignavibacteriota bacterium]